MSIKIKGVISIGYSQAKQKFEFDLEDIGLTEDEWLQLTKEEQDVILDETLENELSNVLDMTIWVEEENI